MAATKPGDGRRAHRPYLESRRTPFVSRPSSQGLKPISRLRGTAPKVEPAREYLLVPTDELDDMQAPLVPLIETPSLPEGLRAGVEAAIDAGQQILAGDSGHR